MKSSVASPTAKSVRRIIPAVLVGCALIVCVGCQTFNLSEDDFRKQQEGQMVDRPVGDAVGDIGTLLFYVAMIGELIVVALGK